ncbi:MAG: cytochrome c oxidase accessory protein CcoG [Planctomycetota bacterium]|nr:MAG: cytochrome c oxidase accessory protein CcoG [Planctomycetota bacterium]
MTTTQSPKQKKGKKRRPDLDSLYSVNPDGSHNVIHPADVKGRWQRRKKLIWTLLIAIYVLLPWIQIGDHPAILINLPNRHFYLFGRVFNAADFNLFFFFLAGTGITLYIVSAVFGRIWCGFACPHTVFLEGIFRRVERWIEGGAGKRQKLAKSRWTKEKIFKRVSKHGIYLVLALLISHVFLSFFIPVRELIQVIQSPPSENLTAFVFILIFTGLIYGDFAFFREQLCLILCPYGRLQSALYDPDTVQVGYDRFRGEPRGHYKDERGGSCIDCFRCVMVCPTGIDIRNGTQMECVGCSNCIDACDEVMAKVGEAPGLIRYDSERAFLEGKEKRRFLRPRLFAYLAAVVVLFGLFILIAGKRTPFDARLVRLQGAPFLISGETVLNRYRVHLVNKLGGTHDFELLPKNEKLGFNYWFSEPKLKMEELESKNVIVVAKIARSKVKSGLTIEIEVKAGGKTVVAKAPFVGPDQ